MLTSFFQSRGPYSLAARLHGHSEGIYSLAVSPKGDLLASGGEDGVRIWDLQTYKQVSWLSRSRSYHGPVTCVVWTTCKDGSSDTLAYGTGLGHLGISRQALSGTFESVVSKRVGNGKEITHLASDTSSNVSRLVLGTRDGVIQVHTVSSTGVTSAVFSVMIENVVPISVCFADNTARDVIVIGMYCGQKYLLRGDDGTLLDKTFIAGVIGSAAVDCPRNEVVIDNVLNGFDIHQLDTGAWKRTLSTGDPTRKFPKQVAFGEMCRVVVGGSDHGAVYVFNRKTAAVVQILQHGDRKMVQTVTASGSPPVFVIAGAAASGDCGTSHISVWRRAFPKRRSNKLTNNASEATVDVSDREAIIWLLLFLALVALVYQNCPDDKFKSFQSYSLSHQLQQWGLERQTVVQEAGTAKRNEHRTVQKQVERQKEVATATIIDWHFVTDTAAERQRKRNDQRQANADDRKAPTTLANRA